MPQQTIDIGSAPNDGTGDPIRDAFDKCNDNFTELYTGLTGLLDFKGSTDCSANPNYPAASKGDFYLVSVAGKIGGASGVVVEAGDSYFATADNAGGTQAAVGSSWTVIQGNITSYLPLSGGTLTGDLVVPDEAYDATNWDGSLEVPTKNAVRDKIEAVIGGIPGSYSDEQAQDAVGGIVDSSLTYVDATPLLQRAALTGDVTASAGSNATTVANVNYSATLTATGTPPTNAIGYLGCPQNTQNGAYTTVMSDDGKHIYHTSGSAHTWTIDSNANVAYPIGAIITFINENGGGNVTLAITSDTLRWGSSTGSRTLAANGTATAIKVASTTWRLTGDGIT